MKTLKQHPFTETWWNKGVLPAMKLLKDMGLTEPALEHAGVAFLALRLVFAEQDLSEDFEDFLDDIQDNESLVDELMVRLSHAVTIAHRFRNGAPRLTEKELEEHAKRCKDPHCGIKKALERADEVAANGLKLNV